MRAVVSVVLAGALGIGVAAVACGSDDESPPAAATPDASGSSSGATSSSGTPANDGGSAAAPAKPGEGTAFCRGTADVLLANALRCCSAAERDAGDGRIAIAILQAGASACGPALEASIAKGRLAYDGARGAACMAEYTQLYANDCANALSIARVRDSEPCALAFVGTVVEGGACASDLECAVGLTCIGWGQNVEGTCKQPPAIGQPCGDVYSDAGTIRNTTEKSSPAYGLHPRCADGTCKNRVCEAKVAPGGACQSDEECPGAEECRNGSCTGTSPSGVNGPCASREDCQFPLKCTASSPTPPGMCVDGLPAGSPCSASLPCKGRCVIPDGGGGACVSYCGSG